MSVPVEDNPKGPEDKKSEEVIEKKDMEEFPIVGEDPKDKYPDMDKFPIIGKEPEDKEPEIIPKKKSHRLRNWVVGISLLAAAAFAGDYYLQDTKTNVKHFKDYPTEIRLITTYRPGKGWKHLGRDIKYKGKELYHKGTTKVNNVVKLEERVTKLKEVTDYDKYKPLYQIGGVAVAAGLAAGFIGYSVGRRKKK